MRLLSLKKKFKELDDEQRAIYVGGIMDGLALAVYLLLAVIISAFFLRVTII
jgi:hypothetical protein